MRRQARPSGTNAFSRVSRRAEHDLRLLDVLRADLEPQRHAAHLPLVELPAGRLRIAIVEHHADAGARRARRESPGRRQHGLLPVATRNRDDHDLLRRDLRRQDEAAVVAVRHDDAADQARGHAPRRVQTYCTVLSRAWNLMSNALAKFCPRLCDVPACSARPSRISASME